MRKHFLILMLLTLLPLAGWAQNDYRGYAVTLSATSAALESQPEFPTVTLEGETVVNEGDQTFTATWAPNAINGAGEYTVTVESPDGVDPANTMPTTPTATFTVYKAIVSAPTGPANDLPYTGAAQTLVNAGTPATGHSYVMSYALGESAASDPASLTYGSIPTATDMGTYYVYYKVTDGVNTYYGNSPITVKIVAGTLAGADVTINLSNNLVDGVYQLDYVGAPTAPGMNSLTVAGTQYTAATWSDLYEFEYFASADAAQALDYIRNSGDYWVGVKAKANNAAFAGTSCKVADRVKIHINKATLTITLQDAEKEYGEADPATLQITPISALKGTDDINGIGAIWPATLPRVAGEDVNDYNYSFAEVDGQTISTEITSPNYNIIISGQPKLNITRATLDVYYDKDGDDSKTIVKEYGDVKVGTALLEADFNDNKVSVLGWKGDDENSYKKTSLMGKLTLMPTDDNANIAFGGNAASEIMNGKSEQTATLKFKKIGTDNEYLNYTVVYHNPALKITQAEIKVPAELPEEDGAKYFDFAKDGIPQGGWKYDAQEHKPNYTVTFNKVKVSGQTTTYPTIETLEEGADKDFTITFASNDALAANNINAGTYTAKVVAVANGNYYTAEGGVAVNAFGYSIGKKAIAVYVADQSKPYTGAAQDLTNITPQWSNLEDDDAAAHNASEFFEVKFATVNGQNIAAAAAPTNAGDYKIAAFAKMIANPDYNPDALEPGLEQINAWETSELYYNYTANFSASNYKVNPVAATVTPLTQSMIKGQVAADVFNPVAALDDEDTQDVNEGTVVLDGIKTQADEQTLLGYIKLVLADGTYAEAKDYQEAISVEVKDNTDLDENAIAAKVAFLANYTIDFTANKGTFVVSNANFTLFPTSFDLTYGDEYQLGDQHFGFGTLNFDGTIDATKVSYSLKKGTQTWTSESTDLPKNAGTYKIMIALSENPAGYDAPQTMEGTMRILPATLKITPKAQILNADAKESILDELNVNNNKVTIIGKKYEEDVIEYSLVFNTSEEAEVEDGSIPSGKWETVAATATTEAYKKLTAAEDDEFENGIMVVLGAATENNANGNYILDVANMFGKIEVIGANTLVLDRNDVDLVSKIQAAATASHNGNTELNNIKVKFANRTMKAKKWYAMVLPFTTSVSELSPKFGYAVVNVLKEQNDPSKVQFKLYMEQIPANTPFLVKVYDAANKTGYGDEGQYGVDLDDVEFTQKTITTVANDGLAEVTDGTAGNKFIGTYKAQAWTETSNYRWILNSGKGEEGKFVKCDEYPGTCSALGAYLETASNLDSFARSIFVEEPDGSTTAINTITGEQINFVNDAWYTLNGVKLNGMPTEKGVYINNGKKIVIK
jgi:hypothetical protein